MKKEAPAKGLNPDMKLENAATQQMLPTLI